MPVSAVKDVVTNPKSKLAKKARQALSQFVDKIDRQLKKSFDHEIDQPFGVSAKERALSQLLWRHITEHNLRPAKRLRASFIYYGYLLLGGKPTTSILKAATAIELIHTALLMHDDLMDQDDIRRGLPTTHRYFETLHRQGKSKGDPKLFGANLAICAGDLALCIGFELLGKTNFHPRRKNQALNQLFRGIANTAIGQAFDITLAAAHSATSQDILDLHQAKTAIYTYQTPLHIGALLAGATERDLSLIDQYALPGGIAFQLQDDILGLFGDPQKTGKSAHSDIKQGKMTLLITQALKKANPTQKKTLLHLWGNPKLTDKQAKNVRTIIKKTGSLEYSRNISIEYAKKTQLAIPKMVKESWNPKAIDYLNGIAEYMIERDV